VGGLLAMEEFHYSVEERLTCDDRS
jgi:hypothetical protein